MSKRLEILKASLGKKQATFNDKIIAHFDDVKSANGQPMNDKRNGAATLNRWERQNNSLLKHQEGIEATKADIYNEESKIVQRERLNEKNKGLPPAIAELLQSGKLAQWLKYPNTFFVVGVEKARIVWDDKKKVVAHKYAKQVSDQKQYTIFRNVFNALSEALK